MSNDDTKAGAEDIEDYLTSEERKRLLASLHHTLVWVGVKEPQECEIDRDALVEEMEKYHQTERDLPPEVHADKSVVDLHHLIWRLINEKEITDQERVQIQEMIELLEKKERQEEEMLRDKQLTHEEGKELYNETAGVIRSLIDLKDLLKRGEHEMKGKTAKEKAEEIRGFANRYGKGGD
jgi:hypothetical protein